MNMTSVSKLNFLLGDKRSRLLPGWILLVMTGALVEALGIGLIIPFITLIQNPAFVHQNALLQKIFHFFHFSNEQNFIVFACVFIFAIFILKNIYLAVSSYLQFGFIYKLQAQLSTRLLTAYLRAPYVFHLQRNSAYLLKNVKDDVLSTCHNFLVPLVVVISEVIVGALLMGLLFYVDFWTALSATAILGGASALFFYSIRKKIGDYGHRQQHYVGEMIKWCNHSFGGIKEASIYGRLSYFIHMFSTNVQQMCSCLHLHQIIIVTPRFFIELLAISAMVLIVFVGFLKGDGFSQVLPKMALFAITSFRLMPSMNRILSMTNQIKYHGRSMNIVYDDLVLLEKKDTLPEVSFKDKRSFQDAIELKNIHFQYPETNREAVRDVSLIIPKNKSIALVGSSGSGKTTLVDIILGLLKPTGGSILIDGEDLFKNREAWQRNIGYIPQTIFFLDDTIRNNVAFGIPDEDIDDELVWKALRIAQLDEAIRQQAHQLDTFVGERGIRLSGGERQRLGIARALYFDPQVLVMDEATSSLDHDTEREVTAAIDRLSGMKTMIVIAHRITTVKNCDIIYRLHQGELIDRISYNKLFEETFLKENTISGLSQPIGNV